MKPKKPMRELVKRDDWQKVRESLLKKWKTDPKGNCAKLRKFLGNIKTTEDDKLYIVMNYLTGTGFRTGRIKHECITKLRAEISVEMKRRKYDNEMKNK
jgi:hypothetical protein